MKNGDILQGTFHPVVTTDLTVQAKNLIGSRHYFRVMYRLPNDGDYAFRYACEPVDVNGQPTKVFGRVWIPDCDIMIEEMDVQLPGNMDRRSA